MDRTLLSAGGRASTPPTVIITLREDEEGEREDAGTKAAARWRRQKQVRSPVGDDAVDTTDAVDEEPERGIIRFSRLADVARRSLRARAVRRRLAQHRQRRRYHQQQARMCALAITRQMQLLRRDKDILTNFVRLRLYETQSSFSGSDVASSSGMDRSSDSERRTVELEGAEDLPEEAEAADDVVGGSPRPSGEAGAGVAERARVVPPVRMNEEVRKILRLRRRRRRHMLQQGEGDISVVAAAAVAASAASGTAPGSLGRIEQYTDTTRNAAVVMGEKDIKQSLRMQRRSLAAARGFSLPGCAQPASLTAQARAHRKAGHPRAALVLLEQALLLDPMSQRALLERSQCYLALGQPRLALLDAQDALDLNKKSDAALYQKAQALYSMGHFEKALVVYHRCSRLRPENPDFKAGIQRAKEAIMNTIGCLPKDFRLASLERLLSSWPSDEEERASSVSSLRRPEELSPSRKGVAAEDGGVAALQVLFGLRGPGGSSSATYEESDDLASSVAGDGDAFGGASEGSVCRSCNTRHSYGEDRLVATPPCDDVEEEARKIALILSLTSTFDHRNKHLRAKLLLQPASSTIMSATTLLSDRGRPASSAPTANKTEIGGPGRRDASLLGAPPLHRRPRELHKTVETTSSSSLPRRVVPERWPVRSASTPSRPGMERVPPSLGRDVQFLEQIALDPGLRGLPVSGMAEEAVRFLKTRQIFWYRRGPINPDVPNIPKPPQRHI